MNNIYAGGCEVVFACGGALFTSVCEAALRFEGRKVIGVDIDQNGMISDRYGDDTLTLTSAMKNLDYTTRIVLSAIREGRWSDYSGRIIAKGVESSDPSQCFVGIAPSTQFNASFTEADYATLVAKIYNGIYEISDDVYELPAVFITVNDFGNIK